MKLLVVEDEPKIARAIKLGFEQERSVVEIVDNGPGALASATHEAYDVIILDRMLPGGLDGVEVCEKLRETGVATPIIMLTARGQIRDKVTGLNAGADDYVVKPFSFDELLARALALMRRPKHATKNLLTVGNLTCDTISYRVARTGSIIELSQTEYALLEFLMRRGGQVVSKEEIASHVWDFDADILPNTVEVYISYLRNKIDKPFREFPPLIHTMRGFGYKLEDIHA